MDFVTGYFFPGELLSWGIIRGEFCQRGLLSRTRNFDVGDFFMGILTKYQLNDISHSIFQMNFGYDLNSVLGQLLDGSITKFQLDNVANNLHVKFEADDDQIKRKRKVQWHILLHLLREDSENTYLNNLLQETERWLHIKRETGYPCTIVGCSFKSQRHREYIAHVCSTHFVCRNLLCNYGKKCRQRFNSVDQLLEHTQSVHQRQQIGLVNEKNADEAGVKSSTVNVSKISTPCKCSLFTCGQQHFTSVQNLIRHYNSKIHKSEKRPCIFLGCSKVFNEGNKSDYNSNKHFYHHHRQLNERTLKPEFLIADSSIQYDNTGYLFDNPGVESAANIESDGADGYDTNLDEIAVSDCDESFVNNFDNSFNFLKSYADFLNRMAYEKMVPQSTIQIMVSEFLQLSLQSLKIRRNAVENILQKYDIGDQIIKKVNAALDEDECIKAMKQLDTPYKRDQFIANNFNYISPREIILNSSECKLGKTPKESFQYISILEGIRTLFQDETFLEVLEKGRVEASSDKDLIEEVRDGLIIRDLSYLKNNPGAYVGLLYSDAVEITSPLAAGKGRHKILQMFWTIGDLPKKFRSKIDQIQVCVIVKDSILKKYGYAKIYQPLIEELTLLEEGINVQYPIARTVKVCFPFHLGDNLESHSLGGWSTCFSSRDICRHCHIQYNELDSRIHNFTSLGPHSSWTVEQYDRITEVFTSVSSPTELIVTQENLFNEYEDPIENDGPGISHTVCCSSDSEDDDSDRDVAEESSFDSESGYGLRMRCPLNTLQAFHAVFSFPPDMLHDILEGWLM